MLCFSCKKVDYKDLYMPVAVVASPISDTGCLGSDNPAGVTSKAIKGTMLAGKTYNVCSNLIINKNDTLIIQEGVTINFNGNYGIGVKGVLISLGTKQKPNWITYKGLTKTDQPGADPNTDPAFSGKWVGIIGDTSCPLMVIKWTHIEFAGGAPSGDVKTIYKTGYPLFFQNNRGIFVLEDSWIYGSIDDPIRTYGGKIAMFRNTFEKCGYVGGEALNAKQGTVGNFAYNVCIGIATNGPKLSNSGSVPTGFPSSNMNIYNNTIVNCGYRRSSAGRGGSINFEQDAAGMAYNNLMVNCKFGLRVVQNPIADTAHLRYGYNYSYGDSASVVNNFYPSLSISTAITQPQATDIPNPSTFIPVGWKPGDLYSAPALIGANNPQFINAPAPLPAGLRLRDIAVVGNYSFALKSTSPCIGIGFTGFAPRTDVPVDPIYGATEITPPGKDIGAYQYNGQGNQH